jgi:hypothetical protein
MEWLSQQVTDSVISSTSTTSTPTALAADGATDTTKSEEEGFFSRLFGFKQPTSSPNVAVNNQPSAEPQTPN